MITPPFGYNLFYMKGLGIPDLTIGDIYRSVIPYIPLFILVLFLCIVFPNLAMYLPNKMLGK
jgi:TRAP-type mannitol/chloroaromatic compound transport system permease large subunit